MPTHSPRANRVLYTKEQITYQITFLKNPTGFFNNIPGLDDSNLICNLFIFYNPLKDSTNSTSIYFLQFFMTPLLR